MAIPMRGFGHNGPELTILGFGAMLVQYNFIDENQCGGDFSCP